MIIINNINRNKKTQKNNRTQHRTIEQTKTEKHKTYKNENRKQHKNINRNKYNQIHIKQKQ